MVSSIQLGNIFSSGGKNVVSSAGGSGIDTKALIDGLIAAKQIPVTALQDKIKLNDNKSTALAKFQTLVKTFQDASDLLRNVPGFAKQAGNAFDYATASVTSNTSVDGGSYLSVTAQPGTPIQDYTVNRVISLAATKIQTTDNFSIASADAQAVFTTPGANQFGAGTISFTRGAVVTPITLEDGDTLNEVASKFNAVSSSTGVRATIIKIADNSFTLQFSATATGTANDFSMVDGAGNVADPDNVFDNINFNPTQDAADAQFILNGQTITRSNNSISDAVTGLTFTLKQPTPMPDATDLTIHITPDTTVAKNAIVGFINAYNDIKIFSAQQNLLKDDGTFDDTAYLANDSTLRSAVSNMNSEISSIVGGLGTDTLRSLGDLGITFVDLQATDKNPFTRNVLNFDETKLDSLLSSDFDSVRKVFEFDFTSSNSNVAVFSRTNALGVNNFTLNVDPGTSTYQATYTDGTGPHTINLTGTAFTSGQGYTLTGQTGTVLEGLTLLYVATTAGTSNISVTQGIGDRIYNLSNDLSKDTTGAIAVDQDEVKTSSQRLQDNIDRMNAQIEVYRQQQIDKYSQLEQSISQINTLLQSLDANSQARNNNNN